MNPTYLTSCPHCGGPLDPVALGPDSAPWLCSRCRRGWWVSELSGSARKAWDVRILSYPWQDRAAVGNAVATEATAAQVRGTSALPEHLPLLSAAQLTTLAGTVPANSVFGGQVQAALKLKGGGHS